MSSPALTLRTSSTHRPTEHVVAAAVFAVLVGAAIVGCGGSPSTPSADNNSLPASDRICNGENALRFVYQAAGGGQVLPGSQVLSENGFLYLLVDGRCHYWAMQDTWSGVREGQLSEADEASLSSDLRLSDLGELQGDYDRDVCDGTGMWLRFAEQRVRVSTGCKVVDTSAPVWWMQGVAFQHLSALFSKGQPVGGEVRYVLVSADGAEWSSEVTTAAAEWPLPQSPSTLAMSLAQADQYQPGSSRAIAPPDADSLRNIRQRFVDTGKLPLTGGFVPVKDTTGVIYQLFVRDTIPFESSTGLLNVF
jgi:hypothetical protein